MPGTQGLSKASSAPQCTYHSQFLHANPIAASVEAPYPTYPPSLAECSSELPPSREALPPSRSFGGQVGGPLAEAGRRDLAVAACGRVGGPAPSRINRRVESRGSPAGSSVPDRRRRTLRHRAACSTRCSPSDRAWCASRSCPPWPALLGFIGVAVVALVAIDHVDRPRGTTGPRRPRLRELVVAAPSAWSCCCCRFAVPARRWPVLQVLAGPLRWIVWLVVMALCVWVLWQARILTARWIERWSLSKVTVAIWLATVVLSWAAAARLTGTHALPGGRRTALPRDRAEPVARRRLEDREQPHARRLPASTSRSELEAALPDARRRRRDLLDPSGRPAVLLAPVYAAGGYRGGRAAADRPGRAAAALAWRWAAGALNAPGAATFAWAAIAVSAPFLFNTFTVYPEIAAALAVMIALALTRQAATGHIRVLAAGRHRPGLRRAAVAEHEVRADVGRAGRNRRGASARTPRVTARPTARPQPSPLLICGSRSPRGSPSSTSIWGSPWPAGALRADGADHAVESDLRRAWSTVRPGVRPARLRARVHPGARPGSSRCGARGGELRRQAIEIALIFVALLVTRRRVSASGGAARRRRPARWLRACCCSRCRLRPRFAQRRPARRDGPAHHVLLWVGVGIAVTLAVAQQGLLINNGRDGSASLFEWWSPVGTYGGWRRASCSATLRWPTCTAPGGC